MIVSDLMEFSSLKELYEHIRPALETKCHEMRRAGYEYLKEEDIWNYLKEKKWKQAENLAIHEMINDILNTDNVLIDAYFKSKIESVSRIANLEEGLQ